MQIVATIELPRTRSSRSRPSDSRRSSTTSTCSPSRTTKLIGYDLASGELEELYTAIGPDQGGRRPGLARLPRPRRRRGARSGSPSSTRRPGPPSPSCRCRFPGTCCSRSCRRRTGASSPCRSRAPRSQQGVLLDIATGQPVGPYWPESGLVSAALPDGGFLVAAVRSAPAPQRHRRPARPRAEPLHRRDGRRRRPGGIAVDGDTAYVVGPDGAAIVSVPLIDGTAGRSKLGRPLPRSAAFPTPAPGGIVVDRSGRRHGGGVVPRPRREPGRPRTHRGHTSTRSRRRLAISSDGRLIAVAELQRCALRLRHRLPAPGAIDPLRHRPADRQRVHPRPRPRRGRPPRIVWPT